MPSTSIYLPQDVRDEIDDWRGPNQSRSDWITKALRRELEHDHDTLEDLEHRVEAIEHALVRAAVTGGNPSEYLDMVPRVFGMGRDYVPTDQLASERESSEPDS